MSKDICIGRISSLNDKNEDPETKSRIVMPKGDGWEELSKEEYYNSKYEKLEKLVNAARGSPILILCSQAPPHL